MPLSVSSTSEDENEEDTAEERRPRENGLDKRPEPVQNRQQKPESIDADGEDTEDEAGAHAGSNLQPHPQPPRRRDKPLHLRDYESDV